MMGAHVIACVILGILHIPRYSLTDGGAKPWVKFILIVTELRTYGPKNESLHCEDIEYFFF